MFSRTCALNGKVDRLTMFFYLVTGIHGNRIGPTIITVNGVSHAAGNHHNLDSLLYTSMDEPQGMLLENY